MAGGIANFQSQFKSGSLSITHPYPPFPTIPQEIKEKFPDLTPFWDRYEKEIANWVKTIQTQ